MALATCPLNLDRTKRELSPHGTPDFPCAGYGETYSAETEFEFPWHWHDEIEALYVADGGMDVQVPGKTFAMHAGDSVFINSGVLHYGQAAPRCELHSLVFSPLLVSGTAGSAIDRKYVQPLIHDAALSGLHCTAGGDGAGITACIESAFQAIKHDEAGCELAVREHLSKLFLLLYERFRESIDTRDDMQDADSIRIRKMMTFIHDKYAGQVSLAQIASAADIGERECLRCFQRSIRISPVQYLITYRLHQAAALLLADRTAGIADIALDCGFDSPSSFSQLFRRYYKCTPREYRISHAD